MATPVGDSYQCNPGGVIAAGRTYWPAWRTALSPRTWATVAGNTLASLDPALDPTINPSTEFNAPWRGVSAQVAVLSAWSGAAWDEDRKRLWITGGGHADYAGNELYVWDAMDSTFKRLTKPSGALGNEGLLNDGFDMTNSAYFDGQPRSAHTYNNLVMRNGVFWNFQGAVYSLGSGIKGAYKFNGTSWDRNLGDGVPSEFGGTIYDRVRDIFYCFAPGTHRPSTYNPNTGAIAQFSHWANFNASEGHPVYDPLRDLCVMFTSTTVHTMPLNDTLDSVAITQTGDIPPWGYWAFAGVEYDEANDRFISWNNTQDIYILTPPATNPRTGTWVWSKITPLAGTVTPEALRGTYGRFWYSPFLKCCGVVNHVTENMHVFVLE